MFVAVNRFEIIPGEADAFERGSTSRDSCLDGVPGSVEGRLRRGPKDEDDTLFSSHAVRPFDAVRSSRTIRRSDTASTRSAHRGGDVGPLGVGHPRDGFAVVRAVMSS